ncbi:transaldolase [Sciscionella sediminilitoris]|uniref:transaldolase n=1 Tax=Sciscionella sediminilitoris TaxID=1445613 RepID=UPI0004DF21A2|nr:transaldolase [Sciscionella sp. SE31]
MTEPLRLLDEHGQNVWVDDLSRSMVRSGDLATLIDRGITGVTSNPTIFHTAITEGNAYDDRLAQELRRQRDPKEIYLSLVAEDIRDACDLLRPSFDHDGAGLRGWVSLEVDPRLADDSEATVEEAKRLHALIDRPNLFVKIPGTLAGLAAIEDTIALGIPVNVTLLFSVDRHRAAARAYQRGLCKLRAAGGDPVSTPSVASFFVSRVDSAADRRLEERDGPPELRSTLAIANAKLAYQNYLDHLEEAEWQDLAAAGAQPQRCLWASTSVKDPALRDVSYVEALVGPDTITTMSRPTIEAFGDHGTVDPSLRDGLDDARRTLERFAEAGVDYQELTTALERDGVHRFTDSFLELLEAIAEKRDHFAEGGAR